MKILRFLFSIVFLYFSTGYAQVMINGVCWATRNVDMPGTFASNPEDAGMFYQWGSNVGWSSTNPLWASDGINIWRDLSESGNVWLPEKNPCPVGWRVPTMQEFQSLCSSSNYWGNLNGVFGRFFGNEEPLIFLPAAGRRDGSSAPNGVGSVGSYWSCTHTPGPNAHVFDFLYNNTNPTAVSNLKAAYSIRCVAEDLLCNIAAEFYMNDVHYLTDTTFCNKNVNFRAEIEGLHPTASDSIMWYIDNVFETSETTWSKPFEIGTYEIKLVVHYNNDTYETLTGTLKIKALWIKIRNMRY